MKRGRGISLIEIVVAVLIAGILLGVGIPLLHRNQQANVVKRAADSIVSALTRMRSGQVSTLLLDPSQALASLSLVDVSSDNATHDLGDGQGSAPKVVAPNQPGQGPPPGGPGGNGGGVQPVVTGSNVHCNLWVVSNGNGSIASQVSLDPAVVVTISNAEGTQITSTDSTAVVFLPLARSIAFQPNGRLDPALTVPPTIQVTDGPVNSNNVVQGSTGVQIDVSPQGVLTVHPMQTQ